MPNLRSSKVYLSVGIAAAVVLLAKWQLLGVSRQSCVRQIGMGLVEYTTGCFGQTANWSTNSLGIRAEEPSAQVGDSVYTVLYLGWAEPESGTRPNSALMPAILERYINSSAMGRSPFRVIDGSGPGVGGHLQFQQMLNLVKAYRPQLIIYFFVPHSEHIQYASLTRYGATESQFAVERNLIRLSWMAKMSRDPVEAIMEPTMSDLRELSKAAERENSQFLLVWPGTGLSFSAWSLQLPLTMDGLALRVLGSLKIMVGSGTERVRRLLEKNQIQYYEAFDLGPAFWRRMAFSESEQMDRPVRVAKRLGDIIEQVAKRAEK